MSRFSILIIQDRITASTVITQLATQYLDEYILSVSKNVTDVIDNPEPADLILLDLAQLTVESAADTLSLLQAAFPHTPLLLLQQENPAEQETLLAALRAGEYDYLTLNEAGLLVLGRRLANFRKIWQAGQVPQMSDIDLIVGSPLDKALEDDTASQLAIQIIDAEDRVRGWNQAALQLFALPQQDIRGQRLDDLPIAPRNLSRLKDILDQARVTGEPFTIPHFLLENPGRESCWLRVHVYPFRRHPLTPISAVYIVSTNVTDLKQAEEENWQHNQELQILLETSRESSKHLELQVTLEQITDQIKTLLNADNCCVYFLEKDNKKLRPVLAVGPLSERLRAGHLVLGQGLIGQGLARGKVDMINFLDKERDSYKIAPPYTENNHILFAPLTALNGTIGGIVAGRKNETPFEEDDLRFFESLVQQGSSAINNARLFEETHRNLNELAILYEASATISTIWNTQTVLDTLIQQLVHATNMKSGYIAGWHKTDNEGIMRAIFLGDRPDIQQIREPGTRISLAERPALLTALNQQRPTIFQRRNPLLDEAERKKMNADGCQSVLLIPLVVKGETIGWTELYETREERTFSADEMRLARALANQVAVALENAQYLQQTQQTLEETTALYQVASALTNTQDPQTIMSTVLREFLKVLNVEQGSVIIFDFVARSSVVKVHIQNEQSAQAQQRSGKGEGREISLIGNPFYERLMSTHQSVQVESANAAWLTPRDTARATPDDSWVGPQTLSLLVVPIQIREEIVGVLVAEEMQRKRTFSQREVSVGQMMADQLGVALQNAQLYEAEFQRRQQAETLREVSSAVGSSLNLNEVLKHIMDQLGRVVRYDRVAIHLIEGNRRRIIAERGFPHPEKVIGQTFPIKLDMTQPESVVIHKRQPLVIENIFDAYDTHQQDPLYQTTKSWMGIPLIARDRVNGLISIGQIEANAYQEEDVSLAMAFANQVAVALENARLYELEVRELERELEIAHDIQETLLPQFVPQVPGLQISGRSLPARQIGGDFFHFFSVGADQLGVAIGDVSGKGIPAALYMAAAITAIDMKINDGLAPAELLNHLNNTLYNRLQENKMNIGLQIATFMPLAAPNGKEEEAHGSLMTVSSGGMIAPIGATEHGCRFLPVSGFPVGSFSPDHPYQEDMFLLDPFTTIIFTSDGIVEAHNEQGELFGFDRLEAAINEIISERNAEIIAEYLIQTATDFMGNAEQGDDMTVVVVVKT